MTIVQKKYAIIVIDKELEIQKTLTSFFCAQGYTVKNFLNNEQFFNTNSANEFKCDILIIECPANQQSVDLLINKITQLYPNVHVIFSLNTDISNIKFEMINKEKYDLITKPIHLEKLKNIIDKALDIRTMQNTSTNSKPLLLNLKIIGKSPCFLKALEMAKRVAKSHANIFITGESGTGKEVFAQLIHNESHNKKGPFVAINCSAIPENLLESELFGHSKGAFTGANDKKIGLFESAENGTLFLDEIGDLSLSLQAKLLRVLQERTIKRVGENQNRPINCRIISATHKNLAAEVNESKFREDLFFRLNVIPITIPPLRERSEDIIPLADTFVKKFSFENGKSIKSFTDDAIDFITLNQWRGNVRELENTIERAVILSENDQISASDLISINPYINNLDNETEPKKNVNIFSIKCPKQLPLLEEIIQRYIEFAVETNGGARDRTAKEIGIDRKTLYKRIKI